MHEANGVRRVGPRNEGWSALFAEVLGLVALDAGLTSIAVLLYVLGRWAAGTFGG